MYRENNISQLIINTMTQKQYDEAKSNGLISTNELYFIKDDNLIIDEELNNTSSNPVQNRIITEAIQSKQDKIIGTPGSFVIIDENGNLTTKIIPIAEEAKF